jgi:hypothetical protein
MERSERDGQRLVQLMTPVADGPDLRGFGPVHECLCGSNLFQIVAAFEDGQVCFYLTEGICWECGAKVTVPTEIDPPVPTLGDDD